MKIIDLYNVITTVQKVIIKDRNKEFSVVYNGKIGFVPFNMLDRHIKWINVSDIYYDTLELFIE